MEIACLDLEGVLIPEIWIKVAERTGIAALKVTTREIPDYDELMQRRLALLAEHNLKLADIEAVISTLEPLAGATEFIGWLRQRFQVIILSDTFYEFAAPLMRQLGWPTLLCHHLEINNKNQITNYRIRQADPKRQAVKALQQLNFRVIASGDSYNDTTMLTQAEAGILFCPPDNVKNEFPQFPVAHTYDELRAAFIRASQRNIS
jgi:phosphoserine/homoserine phosphotransferase